MNRISYLELPVADTGGAKAFYAAAFGWSFTDFGPTYAATTGGDTDIGFQADPAQKTAAPLSVIEVGDLEAALAAVEAAGAASRRRSSPIPAGGGFISAIPTGMNWRRCKRTEACGRLGACYMTNTLTETCRCVPPLSFSPPR